MYELRYLPLAFKDLEAITNKFKTAKAATSFLNSIEKGLDLLSVNPHSRRNYQPLKPVAPEYRALPVQNYLVFYTIDGAAPSPTTIMVYLIAPLSFSELDLQI